MPKEVTTLVYSYAELKDLCKGGKVALSVLDKIGHKLADDVEVNFDIVIETWQDALNRIGFKAAKIVFGSFYSNGGGAFFLSDIDLSKLIEFTSQDSIGKDSRVWLTHKLNSEIPINPQYSKLTSVIDYIDAEIKMLGHQHYHENNCMFSANLRDVGEIVNSVDLEGTSLDKLFGEWVGDVEKFRELLCRAIYRDLEKEYEYQYSEEYLANMAKKKEYWFTIDGKIYP